MAFGPHFWEKHIDCIMHPVPLLQKWEHVLDAGMCDLLMFDMILSSTKSVFHTIELKKIAKIAHNGSVGKSACLMI